MEFYDDMFYVVFVARVWNIGIVVCIKKPVFLSFSPLFQIGYQFTLWNL